MIKEYCVVIVDNITEEESESVMVFDLSHLIAVRPYIAADGEEVEAQSIIFLTNSESYVLIESYEKIIKDWQDARNTTITRLVQI